MQLSPRRLAVSWPFTPLIALLAPGAGPATPPSGDLAPHPAPMPLVPLDPATVAIRGPWHPARRLAQGHPAVYAPLHSAPGTGRPAGDAWIGCPLRTGAPSLVTYRNGDVTVGAWQRDVSMTYKPHAGEPASPTKSSSLLPGTQRGLASFFEPWWNRDCVTMSAR